MVLAQFRTSAASINTFTKTTTNCIHAMSGNDSFYGYLPSKAAALFGIAYFGGAAICCVLQILLGRYRHYWMLTLALAAVGETIGWGARLWAHSSPDDWLPYMIQLCSLIVTPVFISAADYVLFCRIIEQLGYRLFSIPNWCYWSFFVACDMISLAIQTVGGVQVSSAEDIQDVTQGGNVMRAGIIFQFTNTVVFALLVVAAWMRLRTKTLTLLDVARWPAMVAMCVSTLMLLLRNGYRIVELSGGWNGHVMRTEAYLIGLDMVPMAIAVGSFVVFSPSLFFWSGKREKKSDSLAGSLELGSV